MQKFIKVTDKDDGQTNIFNIEHIVNVHYNTTDSTTKIETVLEQSWEIKETVEEVLQLIRELK